MIHWKVSSGSRLTACGDTLQKWPNG
jgi:hypothetical protein